MSIVSRSTGYTVNRQPGYLVDVTIDFEIMVSPNNSAVIAEALKELETVLAKNKVTIVETEEKYMT